MIDWTKGNRFLKWEVGREITPDGLKSIAELTEGTSWGYVEWRRRWKFGVERGSILRWRRLAIRIGPFGLTLWWKPDTGASEK